MSSLSFHFLLLSVSLLPSISFAKSTIEPCSVSDTCPALVGYSLYTDLKVSQVASLFQIDSISLLSANAIDISYADVENHILPAQLFLNVPLTCSCSEGIRKSVGTRYKTRPSDTLSFIADTVFSGLVSADQIRDANGISDPSVLDVGQTLTIPLPCTCFNGTDNGLPAVYLSYVVRPGETVAGIAARYSTTVTDVMTVNAMGSTAVKAGDILSIPLPVCVWCFVLDYTAGLKSDLYCMPSPLAVSCSSMQCRNSNLMLGNVTAQPTSAGCNVTTCTYGGFVNGTILTTMHMCMYINAGYWKFTEVLLNDFHIMIMQIISISSTSMPRRASVPCSCSPTNGIDTRGMGCSITGTISIRWWYNIKSNFVIRRCFTSWLATCKWPFWKYICCFID
ncbi:LysM domain-containing GPI-anchored protein 1 [Asimina triloba]